MSYEYDIIISSYFLYEKEQYAVDNKEVNKLLNVENSFILSIESNIVIKDLIKKYYLSICLI